MCAVGAATIFRTAVQTLRQWPEWKKQLILAAQTSLPMVRWSQGLFYPEFWDSQAIAFNLDHAYRCFPGDRWAAGARSTFDEITKAEITSKTQIQGLAYTNLVECSFANDLESIVSTRLIKMFGLAWNHNAGMDFQFKDACNILRSLRKHDAMQVIKTWVNSWATSYRYHEEPRLPCLLGCVDGCDAQHHYVYCTHIRQIQDSLLYSPPSPSALTRIGIIDPTRDSLLTVMATFAAYHAVKRSPFISGLDGSPLNLERAHDAHLLFVGAFSAAARDAGLACRAAVRTPLMDH